MTPRHAMVIARYTEDMGWLDVLANQEDIDLFVYNKGPPVTLDGIKAMTTVPNRGREAETYARFVNELYASLHHYHTVTFLQGNPQDHMDPIGMTPQDISSAIRSQRARIIPLGQYVRCRGDGTPHHPGLLVDAGYRRLFKRDPPPEYRFVAGAQYCVPTTQLLSRPHAFWSTLQTLLYENAIDPWTMERLWPTVFSISE